MLKQGHTEPRLPVWMTAENKTGAVGAGGKKLHFIRNTMEHIAEIFLSELYSEKYAGKPMLLQLVDARIKVITFLAFLIFGGFAHSLLILTVLAVIPVFYAAQSGVKACVFLRRIWLTVPLLVLLFSLPGATNLFVPGKPLFWLVAPGVLGMKNGLYFSWNGIQTAFRLTLRTGLSLSFGFLLLLTTRWQSILEALAAFHLPKFFLSVCNMAYRYLFVLSLSAVERMEARFLRTAGRLSVRENRRFMGHSAANLFLKSHRMSEEIFEAMCCRGYTGEPAEIRCGKITGRDIVFLISCLLILLILFLGELLF